MVLPKEFALIIEVVLSFITSMPKAQRILLNYGTYECLLCLLGRHPDVPPNVRNPSIVLAFEEFCKDSLHADLDVLLDERNDIDTEVDKVVSYFKIDPRYRHLILDAVTQMRRKSCDIRQLNGIASIKVEESNEFHCKLMDDLWEALDDREVPASFLVTKSIGKENVELSSWGDLGFQTPFTDFRMTGLLGLTTMHYVATNYREQARKALALSNTMDAWFPYAITSINVTSWLLEDFTNSKLAGFSYNNDQTTQDMFNILHAFYFFSFVEYWKHSGVQNILDFKPVSQRFRVHILKLLEDVIEEALSSGTAENDRLSGSVLLQSVQQRIPSEDCF